jgi:hypothetical protein
MDMLQHNFPALMGRIRIPLGLFTLALVVSGATAIPLVTELNNP